MQCLSYAAWESVPCIDGESNKTSGSSGTSRCRHGCTGTQIYHVFGGSIDQGELILT